MRILLDTSYLYDLMETSGKFSDNERRFFAEQEAQLYVSVVSIWEMPLANSKALSLTETRLTNSSWYKHRKRVSSSLPPTGSSLSTRSQSPRRTDGP